MSHFSVLRTVNTPKVALRIAWAHDDDYRCDVQDEHGNVCEATLQALRDGELTAFLYRVSVELNGVEVAETYLGGCLYETAGEGLEHRISGYLPQMVAEVCDDARKYAATMPTLRS